MLTTIEIVVVVIACLAAVGVGAGGAILAMKLSERRKLAREPRYIVEIDPRTSGPWGAQAAWPPLPTGKEVKRELSGSTLSSQKEAMSDTLASPRSDRDSVPDSFPQLARAPSKGTNRDGPRRPEPIQGLEAEDAPRLQSQCAVLVFEDAEDEEEGAGHLESPTQSEPIRGLAINGIDFPRLPSVPTSPMDLSFGDSTLYTDPSLGEAETVAISGVEGGFAARNPFDDNYTEKPAVALPERAFFSPESVDDFEFPETPISHDYPGIQKLEQHPYEIELSLFDSFAR